MSGDKEVKDKIGQLVDDVDIYLPVLHKCESIGGEVVPNIFSGETCKRCKKIV